MRQKIKNALISVSDKSDLKKIIQALKKYKINIISSGGTATYGWSGRSGNHTANRPEGIRTHAAGSRRRSDQRIIEAEGKKWRKTRRTAGNVMWTTGGNGPTAWRD